VAADYHVHELAYTGVRWWDNDLTQIAGAPNALGGGIGIAFDPVWNFTRTHYVAADHHVHDLFYYDGRWQDADLTMITGGPDADGSALTIAFDPVWQGMRTHYVARDNHVHELFLYNGRWWQDADLTQITGGPNALGRGIAIAFDPASNFTRTDYVAADYHVHELAYTGGRWNDKDLTPPGGPNALGGGIAIAFDPVWNFMRTHYVAADHHVHDLVYYNNGQWQDADLTIITGGLNAVGSQIAMAFDPIWNGMRTHYVDYGNHIHELFLVP
jgi:hypothetical protein